MPVLSLAGMENITKALQKQFREDKGKREHESNDQKNGLFPARSSLFLPALFTHSSLLLP
jgi:hypothetical protein